MSTKQGWLLRILIFSPVFSLPAASIGTVYVDSFEFNNARDCAPRIDRVWLGSVAGIESDTLGADFLDAFESRRETYIGP